MYLRSECKAREGGATADRELRPVSYDAESSDGSLLISGETIDDHR